MVEGGVPAVVLLLALVVVVVVVDDDMDDDDDELGDADEEVAGLVVTWVDGEAASLEDCAAAGTVSLVSVVGAL